jgi:hypothetical protein
MNEKNERRPVRHASPGGRSERLAAELKSNLKKRKEQARARRKGSGPRPSEQDDGGK